MAFPRTNWILFIVSLIFIFALFSPGESKANIYVTECGETVRTETSFWSVCCRYECCKWDEEGYCIAECCVKSCTQYSCSGAWIEYKADTIECEPKILVRECRNVCGPATDCCSCGPCQRECGPWEVYQECKSWHKAKRDCEITKGGLEKPVCECKGECLDAPEDPRYYNNPTLSHPATSNQSKDNVFLPLSFAWKNVRGFGQTEEKGPKTYRIEIDNTNLEGDFGFEVESGIFPSIITPPDIEFLEGQFNLPTENTTITSCFGWRNHPLWGYKSFHTGIDIGHEGKRNPETDPIPIFASAGGVVTASYYSETGGKMVIIEHPGVEGGKWETRYLHFHSINPAIKPGARVSAGDVLGIMGSTGWSTGVHLHFDVKLNNSFVDVLKVITLPEGVSWKGVSCPNPSTATSLRIFLAQHTNDFEYYHSGVRLTLYSNIDHLFRGIVRENRFPADNCLLKSGQSHTWTAQACCDFGGTECGEKSEAWKISTNTAPEPKTPYDHDWQGLGIAANIPFDGLKLKWCKTEFEPDEPGGEPKNPASFKLNFYVIENGEEKCHPELWTGTKCLEKALLPEKKWIASPPPEFSNEKFGYFTKNASYAWRVSACKDKYQQECTDYSQKWRFSVAEFTLGKSAPFSPPNDPSELTPVGLPVTLLWTFSPGTKSYRYEISGLGERKTQSPSASFDYPQLNIDTAYNWKVKSCWDYDSEMCENEWSETFLFRTTGRPPQLIYPKEDNIPIPIKFGWEAVGGAKSYVFKIQGGGLNLETAVEKPEFSIDYPDLKQETNYTWQVKTCARERGNLCGAYGSAQSFRTFRLPSPADPAPQDSGEFLSYQKSQVLSWQAEYGKFYEYQMNYVIVSPEEMNPECQPGEIIPSTITNLKNSQPLNLTCFGGYQWKVRACFDENCEDASEWSQDWFFSFVAAEEKGGVWGIVPCGRVDYNPNTPWDEREPCGIKHIFLLVRNIIDFLLWTLSPILLVLLTLASGVMFYFSLKFQDAQVMPRIRLLWKAAAIGYGIILFSWLILNTFLGLMGFQVNIFGQWYEAGF